MTKPSKLHKAIQDHIEAAESPQDAIRDLRAYLHTLSPCKAHPVDHVQWIPIDQVQANNYNPNKVATKEMQLLLVSIEADGYTQPCVVYWEEAEQVYIIVDGFHRYSVMRANEELRATTGGLLPCVVLDCGLADRMASTVRHNRARGKHSVQGMAALVYSMLEEGKEDAEICNQLGMEAVELVRLKHITGYSKLYADCNYSPAWCTTAQIELAKNAKKSVL